MLFAIRMGSNFSIVFNYLSVEMSLIAETAVVNIQQI
jgi:hypothetical protein